MTASKCCCGAVRITSGARFVAVLFIIQAIFSIFTNTLSEMHHVPAVRIASGVLAVIQIAAAAFVFVAVKQRRAELVFPMIFFVGICLLLNIAFFYFAVCGAVWPNSHIPTYIKNAMNARRPGFEQRVIDDGYNVDEVMRYVCVVLAVIALVVVILCAWFFAIFFDCFKYLKYYRRRHERASRRGKI